MQYKRHLILFSKTTKRKIAISDTLEVACNDTSKKDPSSISKSEVRSFAKLSKTLKADSY